MSVSNIKIYNQEANHEKKSFLFSFTITSFDEFVQ
jgi:hypothetical protein